MPYNGAGVFSPVSLPGSWNPATDGSPATPTDWNTLLADLALGLTTAMTKDGQSVVSADISLNTHKLTGLAPGTLTTHAPNILQIQRQSVNYCTDNSVSGAAYVLVASPAITVLTAGTRISWTAAFTNTDSPTLSINGLAGALRFSDNSTIPAGMLVAGTIIEATCNGATFLLQTMMPPAYWQQNVQVLGSVATGTTLIPWDDTIPQITEGDEYITCSITPKRTGNKLLIRVTVNYAYSISDQVTVALFRDSTANALAASSNWASAGADPQQITFTHIVSAGSLAASTFRVRAGGNSAGTFTFNGAGGARKFGTVNASSISIEEVT